MVTTKQAIAATALASVVLGGSTSAIYIAGMRAQINRFRDDPGSVLPILFPDDDPNTMRRVGQAMNAALKDKPDPEVVRLRQQTDAMGQVIRLHAEAVKEWERLHPGEFESWLSSLTPKEDQR